MEINEVQDPDYEVVTISNLGFVDPYGNEGLVISVSYTHLTLPTIYSV